MGGHAKVEDAIIDDDDDDDDGDDDDDDDDDDDVVAENDHIVTEIFRTSEIGKLG